MASAVMPIKVKTSGVRVIDPAVNALLKPVFNKALRNTLNRECPDITFLPVKEGIVATTENSDFTFSVEVRGAFKSLDFDPFLENRIYEKEKEHKRKLLERKEQTASAGRKTGGKIASIAVEQIIERRMYDRQ